MARRKSLIRTFSTGQRFVHWLHMAVFLLLLGTGMVLYLPQLSPLAIGVAGIFLRLMHRVGAVVFGLVPITYLITDPGGLVYSMRQVFTWGAEDLGWLKAAPAYYFLGDEAAMPPQGKFNTGQKLFYLVVVICFLILGVTGLIMWFGKGTLPTWVFRWSVFIHDLAAIASGSFFLVHLYLSVMHPLMKGALDGMLFGWMPEEYVKRHHAKYYQEQQAGKGE